MPVKPEETIDGSTGKRTRIPGSITSVWTLQVSANGAELVVERTGFRALAPALLLGTPTRRPTRPSGFRPLHTPEGRHLTGDSLIS